MPRPRPASPPPAPAPPPSTPRSFLRQLPYYALRHVTSLVLAYVLVTAVATVALAVRRRLVWGLSLRDGLDPTRFADHLMHWPVLVARSLRALASSPGSVMHLRTAAPLGYFAAFAVIYLGTLLLLTWRGGVQRRVGTR